MEMFQATQRIMVNEGPHRPVMGDDLARKPDQAPESHALGLAVRCFLYFFHKLNSKAAECPSGNMFDSKKP
jgi:hypothetical protein